MNDRSQMMPDPDEEAVFRLGQQILDVVAGHSSVDGFYAISLALSTLAAGVAQGHKDGFNNGIDLIGEIGRLSLQNYAASFGKVQKARPQ